MSPLRERWTAMEMRERALAGGLAAVAVFALLYVFLFAAGGGEPEPFVPRPGAQRPPATPTASPSPRPVPETFEVFEGKDPFRPLITSAGNGGTGTPGNGGSGTPGNGGTGPPGNGGTPTPGPDGGPSNGQRVSLLDIYARGGTRFATVEVDGETFTVKKGDRFAGSFRVIDLTARCGTFVFGDERFTLCIGQEVLK